MRICRYTKKLFRHHVGFIIGNTYIYEIKEILYEYHGRAAEKKLIVFLYNFNLKEMGSTSIIKFNKNFIDLGEERAEKINNLLNDISS